MARLFKYTFEKQNSQLTYFTQKENQTSLFLYTPKNLFSVLSLLLNFLKKEQNITDLYNHKKIITLNKAHLQGKMIMHL